MKHKNATRKALFTSIISMLLCVSMLVGTTFAWFTDEVKTGMNTIAAGNLDVELLADGVQVKPDTKLFLGLNDKEILWEPGVVAYENLQVANVGTLALKYQMTLNFGDENDLKGHKLSEVLKVAVLNEAIDKDNTTREQVLALAKAAPDQGKGALSNFYLTGALAPKDKEITVGTETVKDKSSEMAVVIYWEPNSNEVDNLYNANNGQVTSDGEPLHIEFGVNLQATQLMSEEDSFGNDYDEFASILPKATVNNLGKKTVTATTTFPNGNDPKDYDLDVAFQFLPNETYEEAQSNAYRYWHADYVIKADKDVPANSMALAGYYAAFCKDYNNDNWVLLSSDDMIPADTEIRLVQQLGNGSISVNYEEICKYGNDGVGFQCGAIDLTGENAGTTITVELRLYETTIDPANPSGTANQETGNYEVIGTYTYTFGGTYSTLSDGTVLFYEPGGDVVLYDTQAVQTVDYVVPEDVTSIGNYAFSYNNTIETVTMGPNVKDLGRGFDSNTTIKKVVLNEGLEIISSRAFRSTTALEEVVISSTVKEIADNAFQKSGIKNIVIPATVETVGETAFGASKIETVTFEGNTSIQGYAFRGCPSLHTVTLNGDDVTFIPSTLNGRNSTWFCNGESNNPNTSNITFHVENEVVAIRVKTAMGAEADNTPVYINGQTDAADIDMVNSEDKLQTALNNAVDGTVIAFTSDIAGNATLPQASDTEIIIDGCGYDFAGVITVDGKSATYTTAGLTIQNVNFVADSIAADACIQLGDGTNATRYTCNVTVKNCTFDVPGAVGVKSYTGGDKNLTITGCTATANAHSLVQAKGIDGILVEKCKVYSKNGLNFNNSTNVTVDGCEVDVKGYAVRFGESSGGVGAAETYAIKNSTLKSANEDGDAVIILRGTADNSTLTITNTTIVGTPDITNTATNATVVK